MEFDKLEKSGQVLRCVLEDAGAQCLKYGKKKVATEHLLLALLDPKYDLACRALASMGINQTNAAEEMRRAGRQAPPSAATGPVVATSAEEPPRSGGTLAAARQAQEYCRFFGQSEILPEHLLLGLTDLKRTGANKLLDDLGANLTVLRTRVMRLMAAQRSGRRGVPSIRQAMESGIKELVSAGRSAADALVELGFRSGEGLHQLPRVPHIIYMVFVGYLADFLIVQVPFQRYLLQEELKGLQVRSGQLDQELTATIVSNGAQHMRSEVHATIEYLWGSEYRMLNQMLDDAEHDLIGADIEDLWWAHSEEIALDELFDAALVDHRRKHVLSLQKRRNEIAQRINACKKSLTETIRQCFRKRTASA